MFFKISVARQEAALPEVNLRCPACRRNATLTAVGQGDVVASSREGGDGYRFGQRICPNPECRAHIFTVLDLHNNAVLVSYPGETIDFDATDLPKDVLEAFEEAIKCHAQQCYVGRRDHGAKDP